MHNRGSPPKCCKYLNARYECNDIIIFIYSHYPLDPNSKLFDNKCFTLSFRWFCIRIERVMTVYEHYNVIAFKSFIQIFTVFLLQLHIHLKKGVFKNYCNPFLTSIELSRTGSNVFYPNRTCKLLQQWPQDSGF